MQRYLQLKLENIKSKYLESAINNRNLIHKYLHTKQ